MNISVIIPNYNGSKMIKKNLPVVISATDYFTKKTGSKVEIIIVDDYSSDESIEVINDMRNRFTDIDIKLYINKKNLGFSSTVNAGVNLSVGEIILLLNTDVVPKKDFLIPLIVNFKNNKVFGVGCMDESFEGKNVILRGRGLGKWRRGFLEHRKGDITAKDTLWVSGGSSAYRKNVWDALGGLYQIYNPFYWEDIDISYRALKAGYSLIFERNSAVYHYHDSGVIKTNFTEFEIKVNSYKNQFIFSWINISDKYLLLEHLVWIPYHIIKSVINCDLAFVLGLFKAVYKIHDVFYYRGKTQKLVKISDSNVISLFKL